MDICDPLSCCVIFIFFGGGGVFADGNFPKCRCMGYFLRNFFLSVFGAVCLLT